MEHLEVGGLTIAYERRGDGPPLVLVHGGLIDHREWCHQLDELSDEFTVVAWDAPGCGASSDPPEAFRMADYADCLAGLIEGVGLERPHVLGLSWGSTLGLELYRRRRDIPRSLVLTAAYAGWAGSLLPEEVAERLHGFMRQIEHPAREWVREYVPTLLTERAPAGMADELVAIMADSRPAGLRPMILAMARPTSETSSRRSRCRPSSSTARRTCAPRWRSRSRCMPRSHDRRSSSFQASGTRPTSRHPTASTMP